MSNSSSDDELIALENTHARLNFRKEGVHPINRKRREYGEYHHLFIELKKDNQKFFESLSAYEIALRINFHQRCICTNAEIDLLEGYGSG